MVNERLTLVLKRCCNVLLVAIASGYAVSTMAAAPADAALKEVTPAEVFQQVGILNNEIEQIRQLMGVRPPRSRDFRVSQVEPRQVYAQAQTLYRKVNQLGREVAGLSRQAAPGVPDREIVSGDVYSLVEASRKQLELVKNSLGITEAAAVPKLERRRKTSDVMHDLVLTMDVLNQLIRERPEWPDVYDKIVQVITYAGGVLPEAVRYPALPAHECCKMPQDVIAVLLEAMERTRPVAEKVGLTIVSVESMQAEEGGASTDTVYDVTNTLITDFGELSLRIDGKDVSAPDYPRPARIFPSHAYQLAKVFSAQVDALIQRQEELTRG